MTPAFDAAQPWLQPLRPWIERLPAEAGRVEPVDAALRVVRAHARRQQVLQHLADGVSEGRADAVLAASIFHFGEYTVPEAKAYLASRGIVVR